MVDFGKKATSMKRSGNGTIGWTKWTKGWVAVGLLACSTWAQAVLPIERWTSSQGGQVLFMRAPAIPMVDIQVDFDAGSRREPAELTGLAAFTVALLDKAAGGLNENQIEDALADVGAKISGSATSDRISISLRSLTSAAELQQGVSILARILQKPEFPADVAERERARAIAGLRESLTKPEAIAQKTLSSLMYGDHPYGRSATEDSVRRITVDHLRQFHQQHFAARRAVVSMVGDLTRAQAQQIAEQVLAGLPDSPAQADPPQPTLPAAVEKRIDHPSSQSHVLIGMPAVRRGDPDFFPLVVGNYILGGGGFVSRLMNEVREKRGLAYSAYAYFNPMSQLGPFEMGLQTQREQTDVALKVARDTLQDFLTQGPTEAELKAAKSNLVGGFPLRLDSNKKLLEQIALIGFFRLPDNYLDQWTERVEAVTVADIRAAFARRIKPEHLVTVVVGQGKAADAR